MQVALQDPDIARMIRDAVAHARDDTMILADDIGRVPAEKYADPDYYQAELKQLFHRLPLMLAPSCELPNPGDFKTMNVAGVPVLMARGQDGVMRSFLNSCTHRGAAVATEPLGNGRRFVCQYHGWTFDQKGALLGVASASEFGAVDRACMGLKALPTAERAGLIFVTLDPKSSIDIDEYLSGFDRWLSHFNLDGWHFYDRRALPSANWKLAYDATIDYYHVPVLHKDTLAKGGGYSNRALYYPCGPHQRLLNPDARLKPLASMPEEQWSDATVMGGNWSIFPNVTLAAFHGGFTDGFGSRRAMMIMQILPGDEPGTSVTNQLYMMERPPESDEVSQSATAQFALLGHVVDKEDNAVGFSQQASLETGMVSEVLYGRNEGGMQRHHEWIARVIATDDADLPGLFHGGTREVA